MCLSKFVISLIVLLLIWSFANANINVQDRRIRETLQLDDHRKVNDVDRRIDIQRSFELRSQDFDNIRDIRSRNLERRSNNEYERRSNDFERRIGEQRSDVSQRIVSRQQTLRMMDTTDSLNRRDERRFDTNERQLNVERRINDDSDQQTRRVREANDLQERNLNGLDNQRNENRQTNEMRTSDNSMNRIENVRSEHRITRMDDTRRRRSDNRLINEENQSRIVRSNGRRTDGQREGMTEMRAIDGRREQNRINEVRVRTVNEARVRKEGNAQFFSYNRELLFLNEGNHKDYENHSAFNNYFVLSIISLFTVIALKQPNKVNNSSYPSFFKFISI